MNPYLPKGPDAEPKIRAWPAPLIAAATVGLFTIPGIVAPRTSLHFMGFGFGPAFGFLAALAWWIGFSRAGSPHRGLVPLIWLVPMIGLSLPTILAGSPPMDVLIYGWPAMFTVLSVAILAASLLGRSTQLAVAYLVPLLVWGAFATVRIDGTDAELMPEFTWRWSKKPEQIAEEVLGKRQLKSSTEAVPNDVAATDWAEFRGSKRDGILRGVAFDFAAEPKLVWKQKIGPGWGTFSAVGKRLFTQEQRGEREATVSYDAETGEELWRHFEEAKFTEQIAGAGPRATPTYHAGKLYVQGATGFLNCLDAITGESYWRVGLIADAEAIVPQWGMAASPLIVGDLVLTYTGNGLAEKALSAFHIADGKLVWQAGNGTHGYSSPHLATIAGVPQVLLLSNLGIESFDPTTGKKLWEHVHLLPSGNRATQPVILDDGDILVGTGVGTELGTRRLKVTKTREVWFVSEVWFTRKLKPYFNDGVVHGGHYYGFDDKSFVCIDLADGKSKWNAGTKYGHGQVLLVQDSAMLIVQGVDGKVAFVKADPGEYSEEKSFAAIEKKTWNHPIVANGKLYVRNGTEAACYELTSQKK